VFADVWHISMRITSGIRFTGLFSSCLNVLVWDSRILCDKAVYASNRHVVSQSLLYRRIQLIANLHSFTPLKFISKFEGWKERHFYGQARAALSLATPLLLPSYFFMLYKHLVVLLVSAVLGQTFPLYL